MKDENKTITINIQPSWVFLTKEYIQIIRNIEAKINSKGTTGQEKVQCAKDINDLIEDLLKPANFMDIVLDLFKTQGDDVIVKIRKNSDGTLKVYTKEPMAQPMEKDFEDHSEEDQQYEEEHFDENRYFNPHDDSHMYDDGC